jgi:transposase
MEDKKRGTRRKRTSPTLLQRVNPNAAAIDCGASEHYVAVPADRDPMNVRNFRTFTGDLHRLADWLVSCGITTVAMEATGVFWIPVYEILEERKLEVLLVNARQFRNVAGRKSDVSDAEWLQELHSVGLLRASFRPGADIVVLRGYLRHRETLVRAATTVINRMQKAMVQMNLQLQSVISDITGATGLRIVRDIVGGITDPQALAKHRDARCKATEGEITAALTGHYRAEHLFALKQNLELFDVYQAQVHACDVEIEVHLGRLASSTAKPANPAPTPSARRRKPRGNEPRFEVRGLLERMTGTDLALIDGIGPYNALRLVSEIGYDMSRWPTERHFTSWLTLAPQNRISGGRLLSSKTPPSANRAAGILRVAAMSLARTQTALGAFYRRLAYRVGKAKAITATARKLAVLVYRCLKGDIVYSDAGSAAYEARQREAALRSLRRRAHHLGFALVNEQTGEIVEGGVS